ncbi:14788_t:CDS:1, partial [Funneliformis geosporum]
LPLALEDNETSIDKQDLSFLINENDRGDVEDENLIDEDNNLPMDILPFPVDDRSDNSIDDRREYSIDNGSENSINDRSNN